MKMEFKRGAVRNAYNAGAFTYQENLCMDEAGDQEDEYVFSVTMGPINKAIY